MKIAFITLGFTESTIPLAKELSKTHNVDYYVITSSRLRKLAAFDLGLFKHTMGLNKIDLRKDSSLYKYMESTRVGLFNIHYLSLNRKVRLLNKLMDYFLCRRISNRKYDVINIVGQSIQLLNYHKFLNNCIKVHTLHEVVSHSEVIIKKEAILDPLVKLNCPIIVHSDNSYNIIRKYYPDKKDLVCIPFSLFESYRAYIDLTIQQEENTLLFYGQIRRYKGLEILIKASRILHEKYPNLKVIIAGKVYEDQGEYLEQIKEETPFKIINRFLSDKEIVELNQKATVVVCPYLSASQSGIPMTSHLFKRCIVASNVGAFSEVIVDGKTGILINPNDVDSLVEAVKKLFDNPPYRKEIERNIDNEYNKFSEKSWFSIANKTFTFYNQLSNNN